MPKVTLNDLTGSFGSVTELNTNFSTIETAFDNTLSRDGTTPNSMSADIDMDSNDLLNVNHMGVATLTLAGYPVVPSGILSTSADQITFTPAGDIAATDVQAAIEELDTEKLDSADIGTTVQAYDAQLDDIAGLTPTESNFIVGDGTNFVLESGATARASLDVYSTTETNNLITGPADSLVKLIHPDESKGLQELQKQGVYPVSFNQQWGGMGYGGLPDGTLGEIATGSRAEHNEFMQIGDAAARTYGAQGFKISQNTDVASIWLRIAKANNPTNNLEVYIYDDSAGDPNAVITNGTATAQSGKLHTGDDSFEWVKFTFATNPTLTSDTQYYIVLKSSGAVDASNYWKWYRATYDGYPFGNQVYGDATPTWTHDTTKCAAFLIEPATTILTSGISGFDGAIKCYQGSPLNQSGAFYFSSGELNHRRGTFHIAGSGFTKDKTIWDSGRAVDNSRIVLRCNVTTGYAQVDLYEEDGTKHTVTGTSDISTGNHIVSVVYRAEGDGSDKLELYVDSASEGTPISAATINIGELEFGHTIIGGGFPLAPTWTDDEDMSVLPSASGWTFTGTGTEANCMSVSGGVLYQNGAGYAATDTGYYAKTTTLNNATGWVVETKIKLSNSNNVSNSAGVAIVIRDGSYELNIGINEYFMTDRNFSYFTQHDFTKETNLLIIGKGTDYYVYADGKLIFDGAGLLTAASASNTILFGDFDTTSGYNASAQWHYLKYYEGEFLPEYTSATISETAIWADDKNSILSSIYNSGTIQSVKTLAGMNENYVKSVKQTVSAKGITPSPTTTSTSLTPTDEMSIFIFGENITSSFVITSENTTAGQLSKFAISLDGNPSVEQFFAAPNNGYSSQVNDKLERKTYVSLHFLQGLWSVTGGTQTANGTARKIITEAE